MLLADATVNYVPRGESYFLWDGQDEFFASESALVKWRVRRPFPNPIWHNDKPFYRLSELSGATAVLNEKTLSVEIHLSPYALVSQRPKVERPIPPAPTVANGAYLDYDWSYLDNTQRRYMAGFLAPTLFSSAGVLHSQFLYSDLESSDRTLEGRRDWLRLDSNLTRDDPDKMRTYIAGDLISAAGPWGGAYRMGGLQIASNFGTRPAMIPFPMPFVDGTANMPSTVDLYINGVLRHRDSVDSGFFQIEDFPVVTGAGELQMVVTDLFGQEQIIYQDFYASSTLLRPGLADFSYSLGYLRRNYGQVSNDYGPLAFVADHRTGITPRWTAGGRMEATEHLQRAALTSDFELNRGGIASGGIGLGHSDVGVGANWLVGYDYRSPDYHVGAQVTGNTRDLGTLDPATGGVPTKLQLFASAGWSRGFPGSIGVSLVHQTYWNRPRRDVLSATYSRTLGFDYFMSLRASYIHSVTSDYLLGLSLSKSFGTRRSTRSAVSQQSDETSLRVETQYSLPVGPGFGYRVGTTLADQSQVDGFFVGQTDYGRYTLDAQNYSGETSWRVGTQGSVAWLAGRPYLAREISEGFAVAKVGAFENVRVYLDNHEIGRSDSEGRILLPSLRPYETNRVRIEPEDLPLGAQVDALYMEVAPYYRSGTVIEFPVSMLRQAILHAVDESGSALPEGSVVNITGQEKPLVVGLDGLIYVTGLDGENHATVSWSENRCEFDIPVPETEAVLPDLGTFICEAVK